MNESDLPDGSVVREAGTIEENLPMVNYIMLHRIYDMLTLVAKGSVGAEEVEKMVQYHEKGFLLGPEPAYTPNEIKDQVDGL
jgi:hypothetical protein